MSWLFVAGGGALGSLARHLVQLVMLNAYPNFPYGTLCVNVAGSFLIGLLASLLPADATAMRLGLLVGVLGGFTTMSSFALDAVHLVEARRLVAAVGYGAGTVVLCLAACAIGSAIVSVFQRS